MSSAPRRNVEFFEYAGPFDGIGFGLKEPITLDADGYVHPPDKPGLGVELDWDVLDNHTVSTV